MTLTPPTPDDHRPAVAPTARPEPIDPADTLRGDESRNRALMLIIAGALSVLLAIVLIGWITDGGDDEDQGFPGLPDAVLLDLDGREVVITDLQGPTVINFFATWCAPCRDELPEFEEVFQARQADIGFIGVNTRETDFEAVQELLDETGVSFPVLVGDDGDLLTEVGGLGMPTTAFVCADGSIVEAVSGQLNAESLETKITELTIACST